MSTSDVTPTVVLVHGAFVDTALFHEAVCAEAPADVADTLARTQRPASLAAFATAVTGTPARQRLPSWAVVAVVATHPADVATHPADVAAVIVRAVKGIG